MAGRLNGVAKRIQEQQPKAIFIHCMAHCLNLCLQDCSSSCFCVNEALTLTSELSTLIRASPKRLALFETLQNELAPGSPGIKPLCPTRWTVRTGALNAIIQNYSVICHELDVISNDGYGEASRKACGLLALMDRFSAYFGLKLSHLVFAASEQVSITLQRKDINAQEASRAVSLATNFFNRQRSDSAFDDFYKATVKEAEELTQPPVLPRQRKVPKRYDDEGHHHFTSVEDYYRRQYYELLDLLLSELDRRFQQPSFQVMKSMEDLLIKSCNGISVEPSEVLCELYKNDLQLVV